MTTEQCGKALPMLTYYMVLVGTATLILLSGCVDRQEQLDKSKLNLSVPETIGQTETGQSVKRYHVYDPSGHDNYIYVIGNSTSNNSQRQEGKTQVSEVNTLVLEDNLSKQISAEDKKFIEDTLYQIKSCESVAQRYSMAISNVLNKYK